jgi:hypothetical protein
MREEYAAQENVQRFVPIRTGFAPQSQSAQKD